LALTYGIDVLGGVIDSGYRGEYKVILNNTSSETVAFAKGDRVAQVLIQKVERPDIVEVDEISKTERGTTGFGSTGIR
jgi:dUTP pyrophosphatase